MLRPLPLFSLALTAALPAQAEEAPIAAPALEELGYAIAQASSRGDFRLTGPGGESYRSRPPEGFFRLLRVGVPADQTGDGIPELIVIQEVDMGRDVVHVFSLGPEGFAKLMQTSSHVPEFRELAPGDPLPGYDQTQ